MIPIARTLACDILHRTLDRSQDLQAATDSVLSTAAVGPDRALATELSYGYLRLRGRIDHLLDCLLVRPDKTAPALRRILGLAAYELLYLDRIPDYASVDWAVRLVRKRLGQPMSKVANGVLRALIRRQTELHSEEYFRTILPDPAACLAAWHACPSWMAEQWLRDYGPEQAALYLAATLQAPPLAVRINRTRPAARTLRTELTTDKGDTWGMTVPHWSESLDRAAADGLLTRQSLAAQEIMHLLGAGDWPGPILDACAGRGGKTYLLAEDGHEVWAADVNVFRLRQLLAEGRRLGLPVPVFRAPAQGPYPLRQPPRTIVLDAPCSGLGVLSRRPDIKWKRTPADCAGLVALQAAMLDAAAEQLPSGGVLAYVTCTLHRAENDAQIRALLRRNPRLLMRTEALSPDAGLSEFFYGAVLEKK